MSLAPVGGWVRYCSSIPCWNDEATTFWLMAPFAPHIPLTLEELLAGPAWHAQAACRGQGAGEWVKAVGAGTTRHRGRCMRTVRFAWPCLGYAPCRCVPNSYFLSGRSRQQHWGLSQRSTTSPRSTRQPQSAHRISTGASVVRSLCDSAQIKVAPTAEYQPGLRNAANLVHYVPVSVDFVAPRSRSQVTRASRPVSSESAASKGVPPPHEGVLLTSAPRSSRNSAIRRWPP